MLPLISFPGRFELVSSPSASQTGTLTAGSPVVTGLTTAALAGACGVSGTGVPSGAYVLSIDSASQVTLSKPAATSGPFALTFALEPVTVPQAKLHLRVDFPDDDGLIMGLVTAARQRCESELDRAFLATVYDYTCERFPWIDSESSAWRWVTNVLTMPKGKLASVTSISYVAYDGTTVVLDPSTYLVKTGDPGAVYPLPYTRIWPLTRPQLDAVTVRAVWGYGPTADSCPQVLKQAVLMLVGQLYERREATADAAVMPIPLGLSYLLASESWGSRP